jgi:hypothetical protein
VEAPPLAAIPGTDVSKSAERIGGRLPASRRASGSIVRRGAFHTNGVEM